ncbi:MAG: adenylate/guanylate cyclase domain-containing protein [Gallionella sp.]|nr:adenylate/guanylate cyclase domain-containing protein [Gallionella sp.]MDD4947885.1 adenylate/guanylate cyclase domain-containing protein [Gallionella sp.]
MEERSNKTIMSSVLFLDIVEYSKKSVSGQISLKERFNTYLAKAIQDAPVIDRIILDTGDGAAVNFLGDVEDALKAALSLRESLLNEEPDLEPELLVRIGINLGPVRLMRDLNGQPNIVGDGINVAQRVMGFADPSQILVSRSYFDAVSRLSPEYAGMFHYQGSRTDKHVREHEVYAIGYPGDYTTKRSAAHSEIDQAQKTGVWGQFQAAWGALLAGGHNDSQGFLARLKKADGKQQAFYAIALIVPVLLIAVMFVKDGGGDKQQVTKAEIMEPSSAVPSAPTISTPEVVPVAKEHSVPVDQKAQPGKVNTEVVQKSHPTTGKTSASSKTTEIKSQGVKSGVSGSDKTAAPANDAPVVVDAYMLVNCVDGAQVFLDGLLKGTVTNGALTLTAKPGKHKLIISHTSFGLYTDEVELESGKTERVKPRVCR